MKISIIQHDIIWEDKSANFRHLDELIASIDKGTDLVVLPEMFNTGFSMNPGRLYEPPESITHEWMKEKAAKGNFGLCGSYIVMDNGKYFNRWLFVSPEGTTSHYDKRHLFSPGGEGRSFSAGAERLVFTYRGFRICANICYDLRFPVWSRNRGDYDILINSANWPESRRDVWNTLLKARALENLCYVAGANRTGIDGNGTKYCGDSLIIGPRGDIRASCDGDREAVVSAEISMDELADFRRKFDVMKDADDFIITL